MKIKTIVFTGGPCAGKTTAINRAKSILQNRGFFVLTVPEASTLAQSNGIVYNKKNPLSFQMGITAFQKNNEDVFFEYAKNLAQSNEKAQVIVLLDRAIVDGSAYVSDNEFEEVLASCGITERKKIMERYDCVFFLITTAIGAKKFYYTNSVRSETLEEAEKLDLVLREKWSEHPNFFVYSNKGISFETKMNQIVHSLYDVVEIPSTVKGPRKFLIESIEKIPDDIKIVKYKAKIVFINKQKTESDKNEIMKYCFIRESKSENSTSYVMKTVSIKNQQRIELKENLTPRQFSSFQTFSDPERNVLEKTEKIFSLGDLHFEIVSFDHLSLQILNVYTNEEQSFPKEINNKNEEISFLKKLPNFLVTGREVTKDYKFTSHFLSLKDKTADYPFSNGKIANFSRIIMKSFNKIENELK